MNRRSALLIIAVTLVALISLVFIYPRLMISPGALAMGHAGLEDNCFACHSAWRGVSSDKCTTCHAESDIGLRTTNGAKIVNPETKVLFHQQLIEHECNACHISHEGSKFNGGGQQVFSHDLLRTEVRDRCAGCHTAPTGALHRNFNTNCGQCHQQKSWKPATFDHASYFVLDRDHNVSCSTCHTNNDYAKYTCYGCHEHTVANVAAEHREEGIRNIDNCVECHRSANEEHEEKGSREGDERD